MCTNCKAFIHSRCFYMHKKACTRFQKEEKENKFNFTSGLTPNLLQDHHNYNDPGFTDLLNRFLSDDIGKFCQSNPFVISFGQYLFKKSKKRKGKEVETRKSVIQNMRTISGLYLKFKEIAAAHGLSRLKIEAMMDRQYFNVLEETIEALAVDNSQQVKSGAKLNLGNV